MRKLIVLNLSIVKDTPYRHNLLIDIYFFFVALASKGGENRRWTRKKALWDRYSTKGFWMLLGRLLAEEDLDEVGVGGIERCLAPEDVEGAGRPTDGEGKALRVLFDFREIG